MCQSGGDDAHYDCASVEAHNECATGVGDDAHYDCASVEAHNECATVGGDDNDAHYDCATIDAHKECATVGGDDAHYDCANVDAHKECAKEEDTAEKPSNQKDDNDVIPPKRTPTKAEESKLWAKTI